jgi:[ribosomal protein S5]-alanine N-acetyltransferase
LRRPEQHRLDYGYVPAHAEWGQGLMIEALTKVAGWAMPQNRIWRIGAGCNVEKRAPPIMEKAGLEREGILRRWIVHPNVGSSPRDCFSHAIVR